MARWREAMITGQGAAPIAPTLVGMVFLGFSSGLMQKAADTMCYLLCALSGILLHSVPGITVAALRCMESFSVEHGRLLFCAQLLGNLAPLLHWLAKAI